MRGVAVDRADHCATVNWIVEWHLGSNVAVADVSGWLELSCASCGEF